MIVLLDTSEKLDLCAQELQLPVGQLLTPLTRFSLRDAAMPWAIDNGAYSEFDGASFLSLLKREEYHKDDCLFVAVPDVVGSARRTAEMFVRWKECLAGWRLALVVQDGQEGVEIPWDDIDCIFIGGTTEFKYQAKPIIQAAKMLGKRIHAGRVNTPDRFLYFESLGIDSIDGSGISQYSHMRYAIANRNAQYQLIEE